MIGQSAHEHKSESKLKIVLIGSGNVATHLGSALIAQGGHQIVQVYSRQRANAQELAERLGVMEAAEAAEGMIAAVEKVEFTDQLQELKRDADIYFICVSDQAIGPVIAELQTLQALDAEKGLSGIIAHTSGTTPISVFSETAEDRLLGTEVYPNRHGVFYPVQTFSKKKTIDFKHIPLALEASDGETFSVLEAVALGLSERVFPCDSVQRQAIHVAAVFACNFTNYLYALGEEVLKMNGLKFDLIRPLIAETAEKALVHSPATVQTGPAVRKDFTIVQKHLDYLEELAMENPQMAEIYRLLSESISGETLK